MPQISVIVPLYNVERYIADAIRSLKAQSFGDFEAVLVDDGSTDGTVRAAVDAIGGDGRFTVVQQANRGPASARNRGLSQARGTYVAFLDADDAFAPKAFEKLHARAQADDLDYLDFSAHTVYEDPRLQRVRDESFYEGRRDIPGVLSGPELFCAFQRNREYCCALWLHFFKRALLEKEGLTLRDGMYVHEDELFSPLLIAQAQRAAFLNEPLYERRLREASLMTGSRGMRSVSSMFEAAWELRSWLEGRVDECDAEFVAALAGRIAELHELACADAADVDAEELIAYASQLPAAQRVEFEIAIVQGAVRRAEFYGSTTWRAGEALLAVPQALRALIRHASS